MNKKVDTSGAITPGLKKTLYADPDGGTVYEGYGNDAIFEIAREEKYKNKPAGRAFEYEEHENTEIARIIKRYKELMDWQIAKEWEPGNEPEIGTKPKRRKASVGVYNLLGDEFRRSPTTIWRVLKKAGVIYYKHDKNKQK